MGVFKLEQKMFVFFILSVLLINIKCFKFILGFLIMFFIFFFYCYCCFILQGIFYVDYKLIFCYDIVFFIYI